MKTFSIVLILALIAFSQCGPKAVLKTVAKKCMDGNNVPAKAQGLVNGFIDAIPGISRRRLGMIAKAGCDAAVSSSCSAAGIPGPVCNCFKKDLSAKCQSYVSRRELNQIFKKNNVRKLGGCVAGYWPFHTRNTLNDSKFGPWNCISAGVPCAMATSTSAAKKLVKDDWKANGGQSFKYIANGYCTGEKSGSNPWVNPSGITWRFSLLRRRLGMKADKGRRMGAVCDAVLYVANACMNGHNVPAAVQGVVTSGITSALGAFRRRRLGFYDQALNAGCTAAYNAAAGAAGVPPAVATCFRNDIVNTCVAKIHELGGRRLAKKH